MNNQKRKFGDRKDGYWQKNIDAMHRMAPYILRNRADREAFLEETIDLTNIKKYLEQKNSDNPEKYYTIFQVISSALIKGITLRPRLNSFIAGRRLYQRKYLSLAFIAKNDFHDSSDESMIMCYADETSTIDTVHQQMEEKIKAIREGEIDNTTNIIDKLTKMPRPLLAFVTWVFRVLDYFGKMPKFMIEEDPHYSTVFLSNLGSIRMNAVYHHLNNWGTNSIFIVIGEYGRSPFFDKQGNVEMKDSLKIGITLDEMIVDGYYYAKSIKLFKYLLENPHLLELPANEEVIYERKSKNPVA
jgi:hypothetical protein